MSQTVYLQNPVGVAQSYEVEKGVKLSDGASGWVAFAADGGNISRRIGSYVTVNVASVTTEEQAEAAMEAAYASVTIPAGATIVSTYAHGIMTGGFVVKSSGNPAFVAQGADASNVSISQTANQDNTTTVTAHFACNSFLAGFVALNIAQNDEGSLSTQVYLEVVYR